jgi:hypothetical protein
MVTATKSTKTVKRSWLIQWQVRNLFSRTTVIEKDYLDKLVSSGIGNQWFRHFAVYGVDATDRCHVGLVLEISWATHTIHVLLMGDGVSIDRTVYDEEDLAPEVQNGVVIFNQAVNAECLRTKWRVGYAPGVDVELVNRELGLEIASPLPWAGKVSMQSSQVAELPELTVRLLVAESTELMPEVCPTARDGEKRGAEKPATESLFERIKRVLEER